MGQDIGLKVDPRRDEPIYRQIFDQIVGRIEAGTFPSGYKLPPSRVLADELKAHRNTVARAYADLEAAGFVASSVGRGTFVEAPKVSRTDARVASDGDASSMPWLSLLSRAAGGETLGRAERFARRADDRDVINLARMQPSNDLLPNELMGRCVGRVLREYGANAMTYAPPEGLMRLREQIAIDLTSRGVPAVASDVLVTSGSQQGLDLIARALLNPGDTILVEATTYSGAIDLFTLAGARLVSVPLDDHGPDMVALRRLARPDVKGLYLMPNGHNPTGVTIPRERRRELVAWSRKAGIPLIEDDYGAGLLLGDEAPPHLRALDGNVIHMSTFSKRLIPALRVGFVVCPPALRSVLGSMKRVVDLGTSAILQHALAEFMERGYLRAHMNRILPEYRQRRDVLEASLEKALPAGWSWHQPNYGVLLWLRLPPTIDPIELYEEALRQGVLVSPSPMWSVSPNAERGLRLTFCAEPPKRIKEGAKRLGKAVKALVARGVRAPADSPVMEVV